MEASKTSSTNSGHDHSACAMKAIICSVFFLAMCPQIGAASSSAFVDRMRDGERLLHLNRSSAAEKSFSAALKLRPTASEAFALRAASFENRAMWPQAMRDYNAAVKLDPRNASLLSRRAWIWTKTHQHEKAVQDYGHAILLLPTDESLYVHRAYAHEELKQYEAAIEDLTIAIGKRPSAEAYNERANIYAKLGRRELADVDFVASWTAPVILYEQAYATTGHLSKDDLPLSNSPIARRELKLAAEYMSLRHYEYAMQHFDNALKADRKSAGEVYEGEADIYRVLGKGDLALKSYDLAIECLPNIAYLHKLRGDFLRQQDKDEEALKEFAIAVKLGPEFSDTWYSRASLERKLHKLNEALDDLRIAKRLDPSTAISQEIREISKELNHSGKK